MVDVMRARWWLEDKVRGFDGKMLLISWNAYFCKKFQFMTIERTQYASI